MKYIITLDESQVMSLIEMLEHHRCEGEDELCSNMRTNVKSQFQSQFLEHEKVVTIKVDDILESAKKTLGPGYCDTCD